MHNRDDLDRARPDTAPAVTRRSFLQGAGTTALGAGVGAGVIAANQPSALAAPAAATSTAAGDLANQPLPSNFGRMFPSLPPFAQPSDALRAALVDIGKPGGLLDA